MNSPVKAIIILVVASIMLWLGKVYGHEISPFMSQLELQVSSAFWPTWWLYVGLFILLALAALPVAALLSMGGGLLFGLGWGGLAGWLSTSIAAWISFAIMRWWFGGRLEPERIHPRLRTLIHRLDHHSTELLMVLRIVPLVPFYLINVAGAMSSMSAHRYSLATLIGLAPSTFLYAAIGHSLGSWVEAQAAWEQGELLSSSLLGALVALGSLAALSTWGLRRMERLKPQKHEKNSGH